MGAQLSAQEATMNDNVAAFGATVMAHEGHVASEQVIFSEPPVDCLASMVPVGFFGRFHNASGTKKGPIDERMVVDVDVSVSLSIGGSASNESMAFRNY